MVSFKELQSQFNGWHLYMYELGKQHGHGHYGTLYVDGKSTDTSVNDLFQEIITSMKGAGYAKNIVEDGLVIIHAQLCKYYPLFMDTLVPDHEIARYGRWRVIDSMSNCIKTMFAVHFDEYV